MSFVFTKTFFACVPVLFSFSLTLIFTVLAANMSHFVTTACFEILMLRFLMKFQSVSFAVFISRSTSLSTSAGRH